MVAPSGRGKPRDAGRTASSRQGSSPPAAISGRRIWTVLTLDAAPTCSSGLAALLPQRDGGSPTSRPAADGGAQTAAKWPCSKHAESCTQAAH
eukprot:11170163-Alexandrium_andersonii.AAC.1